MDFLLTFSFWLLILDMFHKGKGPATKLDEFDPFCTMFLKKTLPPDVFDDVSQKAKHRSYDVNCSPLCAGEPMNWQ